MSNRQHSKGHRAYPVLAAAAAAAAVSLLTACGGSGPAPVATAPSGPVAAATVAAPANPVPILKATGAPLDPSTVSGRADVSGNRYASAEFPGGEQVTVRTYATQDALKAAEALNPVDDAHGEITGPLFSVEVTGVAASPSGITFTVSPATIAARVHGTLRTS